jgi:hypothetical protein
VKKSVVLEALIDSGVPVNFCTTVQVFVCARLKSAFIVPLVVIGFVPLSESVELGVARVTEVTVPDPPPPPDIHTPFFAKHPAFMFTPVWRVEVAVIEMLSPLFPPIERSEPGDDEAIPILLFADMMVNAGTVEVANPPTVVVAIYRFCAFLNVHWFIPAPLERES